MTSHRIVPTEACEDQERVGWHLIQTVPAVKSATIYREMIARTSALLGEVRTRALSFGSNR
jgi:hypothetical protein